MIQVFQACIFYLAAIFLASLLVLFWADFYPKTIEIIKEERERKRHKLILYATSIFLSIFILFFTIAVFGLICILILSAWRPIFH